MMPALPRFFTVLLLSCFIYSCNTTKHNIGAVQQQGIASLHLLGEYDIPYGFVYNNSTVGGLSGIDYDPVKKIYYMISDDRSAVNPARFYTAAISTGLNGIDSIHFNSVTYLQQPNGKVYPNNKQDPMNVPDPESIRYNPNTNSITWSSEGERIVKASDTILENPSINQLSVNGNFQYAYKIPGNTEMQAIEKGPRQNSVFEGLGFTDNYNTLFVSIEEPLYEDGPRADNVPNDAYTRLLKFDVKSRTNIAQYAYKLDTVTGIPTPANAFKINGVSEILSVASNKLLVIERSFSTGKISCTIKIFIADLGEATDIKNNPSLRADKDFKPAHKKLLLNMDDLGIYIDNIEGVCFGPTLPNGNRTLLFIADNNFNILEKSQLLLFEVKE